MNELNKRILSSFILLPITIYLIIKGSLYFNFFLLICISISLYEWHKMSWRKNYYLIGVIFLLFSFYTAYYIRMDVTYDYHIFLAILSISISSDIGGFIFGKILKGPKLTKISPKKTYFGVLGSFLLPIIFYLISFNIYEDKILIFFNDDVLIKNSIAIYLIILLISSANQIGDIIVSYFKRLSNIKDTGKIIPGHGGILDRIDGMLFAFPVAYILLKVL